MKIEKYQIQAREELNNTKPVVLIDKSLDALNETVLFPEKLAKANERLKKKELPDFKVLNRK
jgi:hypothetical protein